MNVLCLKLTYVVRTDGYKLPNGHLAGTLYTCITHAATPGLVMLDNDLLVLKWTSSELPVPAQRSSYICCEI